MTQASSGIWAMVTACVVWGLSPLYYKLLSGIPPLEILAHRTFWSLVIFFSVLMFQRRLGALKTALRRPRSALIIAVAALMISINWFMFILSIQIGHATEASLGYYLFPLVAVGIGVVAFGETLSRVQMICVAIAAFAVALLTYGLGVAPWVALILSMSFGLYGLIKKRLDIGPVVSVTAEVLLLLPFAAAVLIYTHAMGQGAFGKSLSISLLLVFSGILTAVPLILFSYATKRVRMATIGLVQYLNPTLQFLCATLVFAEPFGKWHAMAFALIWAALIVYSVNTLRGERSKAA